MRVGLLIGTVLPENECEFPEPLDTVLGKTSSGIGQEFIGNNEFLIIARHGMPEHIPPHLVDHRSNIIALKQEKVDIAISVCSCGALHGDIEVPSLSIPGDYMDLYSGATFMDHGLNHVTPSLDERVISLLERSCNEIGSKVRKGDIYFQTRGPRLETRAEVRFLSAHADVVGMSLGPEATLCKEAGIPHGSLLTIDNYANGITDEKLHYRDISNSAKTNWRSIRSVLENIPDQL